MYLLGVDAGATKTYCLVSDERGNVVGFGSAGTGNYEAFGLESAMKEIDTAISGAFKEANIGRADIGCFCLAGADFPEDFDMLKKAVENLNRVSTVIIKNDSIAALRSGIGEDNYGVVVIMGTGTNAAGIDKTGKEARLFGEGFVFGDWGGSGDISREALHRVFRHFDGRGEKTILSQMVLDFFNEPDFISLAKDLYYGRIERGKIHLLAPLVFDAAYKGDRVAVEIVKKVASETAVSAWAIIKQLHLEREPIKVVLGGSVFKAKGPLLLDFIRAELHSYTPVAKTVLPKYEPVVGALLIAFDNYAKSQTSDILSNIDATLPKHLKINREEEIL